MRRRKIASSCIDNDIKEPFLDSNESYVAISTISLWVLPSFVIDEKNTVLKNQSNVERTALDLYRILLLKNTVLVFMFQYSKVFNIDIYLFEMLYLALSEQLVANIFIV